jgi:hypothetical protein
MDNQYRYVYYDKKTGKILSISTKDDSYEHGIRVPFNEVYDLLVGTEAFSNFLVGYKKSADGKTKLGLIPNSDLGYAFKNNIFEWITSTAKNQECIVTWDKPNQCWEIAVSEKAALVYQELTSQKLVFFVTLEHDFDFLIRTIFIPLDTLLASKKIIVPFTSTIENKIDKISISSKIVFKSYGLRIIHE